MPNNSRMNAFHGSKSQSKKAKERAEAESTREGRFVLSTTDVDRSRNREDKVSRSKGSGAYGQRMHPLIPRNANGFPAPKGVLIDFGRDELGLCPKELAPFNKTKVLVRLEKALAASPASHR